MIEDDGPLYTPPGGRAHNQPPSLLEIEPAIADLREWLTETLQPGDKTFGQRRDEFLRSAANAVVRNRETAGAAADVVKMASEIAKKIETGRLERSNRYRAVADALARVSSDFWAPVDDAMAGLRAKIDAWDAQEDARIDAQRREQEDEMHRLRAAAEPAPSPPPAASVPTPAKKRRIQGDYGARVNAATRNVYTIADIDALPDWIFASPTVVDAILTVVRQTWKHMGPIAGIHVETVTENQIR